MVRPYTDGEEMAGTTLKSRYSALEDGAVHPVIRWEKTDKRNGKPVMVQQGCDAESCTLTAKNAGTILPNHRGAAGITWDRPDTVIKLQ